VFNDVDGLYTYTFEAERKVSDMNMILRTSLDKREINTNTA